MATENEDDDTVLPAGTDDDAGTEGETGTEVEATGADDTGTGAEATEGAGGDEPGKPAETVADAVEAALESLKPKSADKKDDKGKEGGDDAEAGKAKEAGKDGKGEAGKDDKKDGEKKPDHVNDPIPPQVSERTRERITSLVSRVKEQDSILQDQSAVINAIQSTGASPEEFGMMVGYMQLVHSDKPEHLEQAYKVLQAEMRGLALKMGRSIPEVDVLSEHKDLTDLVKSGQITQAAAEELAILRSQRGDSARRQQATAENLRKSQEQTAAAEAEKNTAITELNALGETLAKTDPHYQAKYDAIVPLLAEQFKTTAPRFWKSLFETAYKATVVQAAPSAAAAPAKPKQQPIRPSTPSGSTARQANNLHDAIFGEGFPSG